MHSNYDGFDCGAGLVNYQFHIIGVDMKMTALILMICYLPASKQTKTKLFLTELELTILACQSELDFTGILQDVNLKLGVDIREVYQQERVGAGLPNDSLQDAVDDDDQRLVAESFLELPGLPPGLRQPRHGGGQAGEEGEGGGQHPELLHLGVRADCLTVV